MTNKTAVGDGLTPQIEFQNERQHGGVPHIRIYDFNNPRLISKESMRILKKVHDSLSKNLELLFLNRLDTSIQIDILDIKEVVISDYIQSIESPAAVFMFNIEELGEWAILHMDPAFCVYTVDKQSGGTKQELRETRELTHIEERILSRILDRMFKELSHVWAPYMSMTIHNYAYESRPTNIRTLSPNEPGVLVVYTFRMYGQIVPMSICYPFRLVKDYISKISNVEDKKKPEMMSLTQKKQMERRMKGISAPVKVMLGNAKMSIRDLMNLKVGDEIRLDQPIDKPLNITVNGTRKMSGYPGTFDGRMAIKVFDLPKQAKM